MKHFLSLVFIVITNVSFAANTFAQEHTNKPSVPSTEVTANNDDKVYSVHEVDKKATLKNLKKVMPSFSPEECRNNATIKVRLVLRKSGQVTDIKVDEVNGCVDVEKKVIKQLSKLQFSSAAKDGLPVSQSLEMTIEQHLY